MNPVTLLTGRRRYGLEFLGDGHFPSVFGGCVDPSPEKVLLVTRKCFKIKNTNYELGNFWNLMSLSSHL